MIDSMMDMPLTTLVVIGLVLLVVIAVIVWVVLRLLGERAHADEGQPSRGRSHRDREKRAKLR